MKNNILKTILLAGGLIPVVATAHSGHNHAAAESGALHAILLLTGALVIVSAVWITKTSRSSQPKSVRISDRNPTR